ncbi:hypothetical protein FQN54_003320 [Arachnomyces sp. PD_36]|nr:hypothetical protein FQN54_003320 [Arachnomyces sp. PD_36]
MAEEKTPASPPPAEDSVAETQPEKDAEQAAPEGKADDDTEMKNGDKEEGGTTEDKPTETAAAENEKEGEDAANGTPASSKKGGNGKRKSTGGVPEHKNKKLNRKKSTAKITHLDAKPGELYFARLKSYAPWPSVICDEEMLPQSILSTRPVTTMKPDGTYNENYADGGKRVQDRTFPIMFLHTNEFAWIPNTELSPLDPEKCKEVNEKGKAKALVAAYHVAAENHDLQYFKNMLADHQRALDEDQEAREALAAEKAAKAEKKKRKSTEVVEEDEDEDMGGTEEGKGRKKPQSAKKRRKAAESEEENEKPAKTPKTATKLKLTTPKTPKTAESGKKTQPAKTSKAKSSAKKNANMPASDEEAAETPKETEKPLTLEERRQKREKEVLYLRHKLQKGFLSRDQAPKEDEMESMSNFIQKLEQYEDLEGSLIRQTKINKVLKGIIKLNIIPKEEQYQFRKRSVAILGKWKHLLESDVPKDEASGSKDGQDEPKANGVDKKANGKKGSETPASEKKDDAQEDETAKEDEGTKGDKEVKEDVSMADAGEDESKKQTPQPAEDAKEESKDAEKTATATGEDVEMEGAA